MKKLLFSLLFFFFFHSIALSANINFSADKTNITTDDIVQVHLFVNGDVDNKQVGIKGLEHFEIVGQQRFSQIQIINGKSEIVIEKILSLHPLESGNFTLLALAKENGEIIKSKPINISVQKSLVQNTKEKLLNSSKISDNNEEDKNIIKQSDNGTNTTSSLKNLLSSTNNSTSNQVQKSQNISLKQKEKLNIPEIKNFPKVEHISPTNIWFWYEFLGIILVTGVIFFLIKKFFKK